MTAKSPSAILPTENRRHRNRRRHTNRADPAVEPDDTRQQMQPINWLEEDGTPKIGHFQWFAMFLWCEKAKEGTWKKCMAWCQNELNAQLARRLLPEKEKGWIGAAWLGYVAN